MPSSHRSTLILTNNSTNLQQRESIICVLHKYGWLYLSGMTIPPPTVPHTRPGTAERHSLWGCAHHPRHRRQRPVGNRRRCGYVGFYYRYSAWLVRCGNPGRRPDHRKANPLQITSGPFTAAPNERTLPDGRAFSVYSLQVEMLLQGFILSQNLQRHLVC